jgi:hypothetical protein
MFDRVHVKGDRIRRSYLPSFANVGDLWDLKASDYRYLSQMLIYALGSGDETFFVPEFTTKLRKVLIKCQAIGTHLWWPGAWNEERMTALQHLLISFGDEFRDVFQYVAAGEDIEDKCGFIKLHALMHTIEDIRNFGSPFNYSLESWERSHQDFVKLIFPRTNTSKDNQKTEEAMLAEVVRRELLYQAKRILLAATTWLANVDEEAEDNNALAVNKHQSLWRTPHITISSVDHPNTTSLPFTYYFQGKT